MSDNLMSRYSLVLRQRADDYLIVPRRDARQQVHMGLRGFGNGVQVAKELLVAARRGHQNMARSGRADIGETVNGASRNLDARTLLHHLGPVSDSILHSSFYHDKDLVLGG